MALLLNAILDVDGVLLASPHEQAWREAVQGFSNPTRFTSEMYRTEVAGKPRLEGALAALVALGVPDARGVAGAYAARKQARLESLILTGCVKPFADAVRFVQAMKSMGVHIATASSSLNARGMMRSVRLRGDETLLDLIDVDVSGQPVANGKPKPDIFLLAARALRAGPAECFVVEDSPAGIVAAKAAGMYAIGIARCGEAALLDAAGADLVVNSLAEIDLPVVLMRTSNRHVS